MLLDLHIKLYIILHNMYIKVYKYSYLFKISHINPHDLLQRHLWIMFEGACDVQKPDSD